jgi:hypothetical protein
MKTLTLLRHCQVQLGDDAARAISIARNNKRVGRQRERWVARCARSGCFDQADRLARGALSERCVMVGGKAYGGALDAPVRTAVVTLASPRPCLTWWACGSEAGIGCFWSATILGLETLACN